MFKEKFSVCMDSFKLIYKIIKDFIRVLIFTIKKVVWEANSTTMVSYEFHLMSKHPTDKFLLKEALLKLNKKDVYRITINTELFGELTLVRSNDSLSSEEFFEIHNN